jgi:glycosyltransferase involved in cell wall biosynthesis
MGQRHEVVSHEALLEWLGHAHAAVLDSPSASLLDFAGVDAFDASIAELYLKTLAALRRGPQVQHSPNGQVYRSLRDWGYRLKCSILETAARRHSTRPLPSDFLFWPRDLTHTAALAPVALALNAQGRSFQFLACQPIKVQHLKDRGFQPVYALHAWPTAVRQARREGRQRARELARLPAWRLPNFGETAGALLEPALRATMVSILPSVAEAAANAREALRRIQPRVLVVGNDLTLEGNVGCRVAAQSGVATAVFMHGTITGIPMQASHPADRIFVYGDIHRQELLDRGIEAGRIVVCGDPNLDGRARQTGKIHPALKARLGLRDGAPWILVVTSGPGHRISHKHHETLITNLLGLARAIPQVPLVIKLHRKDRLAYYQSLLKASSGLPLHVVPHGAAGYPSDIFDWLQGCGMILTGASTTAIEAMAMDIPVITMDYCGELYRIDFIDAGATIHVTDASGLVAAVKQVLATGRSPKDVQTRVEEFLKGTYFALDGRSSQRAAESLQELAARAVKRQVSTPPSFHSPLES